MLLQAKHQNEPRQRQNGKGNSAIFGHQPQGKLKNEIARTAVESCLLKGPKENETGRKTKERTTRVKENKSNKLYMGGLIILPSRIYKLCIRKLVWITRILLCDCHSQFQ